MQFFQYRSLILLALMGLGFAGCKTESKFDCMKKKYEIPGVAVVDEYSAQTKYKERYGSYPEEGSKAVTEVLERRERSQAYYGND